MSTEREIKLQGMVKTANRLLEASIRETQEVRDESAAHFMLLEAQAEQLRLELTTTKMLMVRDCDYRVMTQAAANDLMTRAERMEELIVSNFICRVPFVSEETYKCLMCNSHQVTKKGRIGHTEGCKVAIAISEVVR